MRIWSAELEELERFNESFKGHHPDLENELERLVTSEDENMVLLYSRRCLEVIITDLCESELKRPRKTEPLKGIIDKLNKEEKVPGHIITSMDHLNSLSAFGAHPKDYDPQQVRTVLINLATVLSWYVKYLSKEPEEDSGAPKKVLNIPERKRKSKTLSWKLVSVSLSGVILIILVTFWLLRRNSSPEPPPVVKSVYKLPQGETLYGDANSAVAISRDGTKLVFVAFRNDTSSLYLRHMNEFEAKPISGTQGAKGPFFSPDGKWIAFFVGDFLKKVPVSGGAPITICEAIYGYQGLWGLDNHIIFENDYKGIQRVPAMGGEPEALTSVLKYADGRLDQAHMWPNLMPGGKDILFTSWSDDKDMRIVALSLESGKTKDLFGPGSQAQYINTGHLVYAWEGNLLAVPFNLKQMRVTGQPEVVMTGIYSNNTITHFSISDNGSLVYIPGVMSNNKLRLVLVNHEGISEPLNFPAGSILSPRFSPDGKKILVSDLQGTRNLWIYGLERGTMSRFSDKDKDAFWGIWSPDGKSIVFNTNLDGEGVVNLFRKNSDGTGPMERLTTSGYHQLPKCWSIDGKFLIYTEGVHPETGFDIWMLPMDGHYTPTPFLNSRFNEFHPTMSPDGRWLAYVSNEPGQDEVFVCSFPDRKDVTQVSIGGGYEPVWAPDGKALYYRNFLGEKLMTVSFNADPKPLVGKPSLLHKGNFSGNAGEWGRRFDITPDGKKFLMLENEGSASIGTEINIIQNWFEEWKDHVPTD